MESTEPSDFAFPVDAQNQIPIDYFGSKKHPQVNHGDLAFADSDGKIVFRVSRRLSPKSSPTEKKKLLIDAAGNTILSIYCFHNGSWKCYKGDSNEERDLVFSVQRSLKKLTRIELEVFPAGENLEDSTCDFKVRGLPFMKSCSIYKGNAILGQTSLMHKLNQIFVSRSKFRLTIYPGSDDALIVALVVIFLNGRK